MNHVRVFQIKEDEIVGTYSMMYVKFLHFRRELRGKITRVVHKKIVE
jgi:hypothetical protein